jgi:hypothetical protein
MTSDVSSSSNSPVGNEKEAETEEDKNAELTQKLNILLTFNRAYQEVLDEKIVKLKKLLKENAEKQVGNALFFIFLSGTLKIPFYLS